MTNLSVVKNKGSGEKALAVPAIGKPTMVTIESSKTNALAHLHRMSAPNS